MLTCFCIAGPVRNDTRFVGTGFYVRWHDQLWIATVAHNMTGTVDFDDMQNWPNEVHIAKPEGLYPVPVLIGPNRAPMFRVERDVNGRLADMLLINLPQRDILAGHRVYDVALDVQVQPVIGSMAYHHGFPANDFDVSSPPRIHQSRIVAFGQHNLDLDNEAAQGFSGGPVLDERGSLLGFTVGSNEGVGRAGRTTALVLSLLR